MRTLCAVGLHSSTYGRLPRYPPAGAFTFASRQAYRLAYRSQRETSHDRALRRAFKLRGRLGGEGGIGDYIPKPKWMRLRTYDRKLNEVFAAEEIVNGHLLAFIQKLERRLGRGTSAPSSPRSRRAGLPCVAGGGARKGNKNAFRHASCRGGG